MLTHTENWHVAIERDSHFEMVEGGASREEAEKALIDVRAYCDGAFLLRVSMDRVETIH